MSLLSPTVNNISSFNVEKGNTNNIYTAYLYKETFGIDLLGMTNQGFYQNQYAKEIETLNSCSVTYILSLEVEHFVFIQI